jgi:hypothetical protein
MLALLAALSLAGPSCGLPPLLDEPLPFAPGESLTYDVDILRIVKAGTLSLTVEPPISRGTLLPLRARVHTTSIFAKVRRVRGYALSWVGAETLRPQRYRDEAEESGERKSTDTRLDRPGPLTMAWSVRDKTGEKKGTTTSARQGEALDLLSMVYYLRAARLRPGEEICFDLVANRRFWRLHGTVAPDSERVESAAGAFDTTRLDAVLTRSDGGGSKRRVRFWFSNDPRRLPVAAVSEIDLGPVRAVLSQTSEPPIQPAN